MKLIPLDRTKRYDLSECTDEELLCVLNWLVCNSWGWINRYTSHFKKYPILKYIGSKWDCKENSNEICIKPMLITLFI